MTAIDLAFQEYGDHGAPLIILHGLFGSRANWRGIARSLARDCRVFVPDLRNHGDSPWNDTMDYPAMAADIENFIDRRGLDHPIMLGHSMGGKAAMWLALNTPQAMGGLIIVDIAPVVYHHTHLPLIDAMQAFNPAAIHSRAEADAALESTIPAHGIRLFLLQNLVFHDGTYHWRIQLDILRRAMDNLIGFPALDESMHYSGPALFLHGDRSDYVDTGARAAINRYFPVAAIETIAGAGHWVQADQPAAVITHSRAFVQRVVQRETPQ